MVLGLREAHADPDRSGESTRIAQGLPWMGDQAIKNSGTRNKEGVSGSLAQRSQ